jgi:ketosteroid isomerase-like protein
MPLSPIEVVEHIVAAWNQRDWDAAESLCEPEIVADYSRRLVDPGVYRGHDAMRDSRLLLLEPWTDVSIELEDTIVYGDNVVALMRVGATGKTSGVNVEARFADLWTIRAGAAVRLEYFGNRDEAIAAASLRLREAQRH